MERCAEVLMPGETRSVEGFGKTGQTHRADDAKTALDNLPARLGYSARRADPRPSAMKVLLLINLQNDFLRDGLVATPDGESIVPLVQQLQNQFRLVAATQDWHPANHVNFAANHAGRQPGEIARMRRREVLLGPVHCVQGTRGAELIPSLNRDKINRIVRTGTDTNIDSFSAFFDGDRQAPTGLLDYLREKRVTEIFLCGLGTDTTILNTALDALGFDFETVLIEDACRGANPEAAAKAIEAMKDAGATMVLSRDILAWPVRR